MKINLYRESPQKLAVYFETSRENHISLIKLELSDGWSIICYYKVSTLLKREKDKEGKTQCLGNSKSKKNIFLYFS